MPSRRTCACSAARTIWPTISSARNRSHHLFCRHCGVKPFGRGYVEQIGGDYVSINLGALDDVDPAELAAAPVRYMDGRHDNWFEPPAVTSYL